MEKNVTLQRAQELALSVCNPLTSETIDFFDALNRVLSENLYASEAVPPFARSPLDGYAFLAADTLAAEAQKPAVLEIIEEVPAGYAPAKRVISGKAVKILTGAPIPEGADAVVKFEVTEKNGDFVSVFSSFKSGENIVPRGDDMREGDLLATAGEAVSPATVGLMASLGISRVPVFTRPKIGIISTGDELMEVTETLLPGKIRNSNKYTLAAAVSAAGAQPVFLGTVNDDAEKIAELIDKGFRECDMVISTGGVSVGDYDMVHLAVEKTGARLLLRRIDIKPGSSCVMGEKDGKLMLGLSGNPAAAVTVFYLLGIPCIRKLAGHARCLPRKIKIELAEEFKKSSPSGRLLRGKLELESGRAQLNIRGEQGNGVLSSMMGCGVIAQVPPRSGPLPKGLVLDAFLLDGEG